MRELGEAGLLLSKAHEWTLEKTWCPSQATVGRALKCSAKRIPERGDLEEQRNMEFLGEYLVFKFHLPCHTRCSTFMPCVLGRNQIGVVFFLWHRTQRTEKVWLSLCVLNCFSPVRFFVTPWTVAYQAPLSIGFSRWDTRVVCHFLLQKYD